MFRHPAASANPARPRSLICCHAIKKRELLAGVGGALSLAAGGPAQAKRQAAELAPAKLPQVPLLRLSSGVEISKVRGAVWWGADRAHCMDLDSVSLVRGSSAADMLALGSQPWRSGVQLMAVVGLLQVVKGCWQLDGSHHGDVVSDRTTSPDAYDDMDRFYRAGAPAVCLPGCKCCGGGPGQHCVSTRGLPCGPQASPRWTRPTTTGPARP